MDKAELNHFCPFLDGYQEYLPCTYDPDMICDECFVVDSFRTPGEVPV